MWWCCELLDPAQRNGKRSVPTADGSVAGVTVGPPRQASEATGVVPARFGTKRVLAMPHGVSLRILLVQALSGAFAF